jgi:hypothetical protein
MTSQQNATPAVAQATGTRDTIYNLVSVLYHALQGADTCQQYIQDADQANDQELGQFFRDVQAWQRHLSIQAQALLTQRLHQGEGREWNQEVKIWNLKIMA